jgi:hypothetical protein
MHSMLISKVDKASRYAHEPDRFHLERLTVKVDGDNDSHQVSLDEEAWLCTCHLFGSIGGCAHVLAVQKMFGHMLSDTARTALFDHLESGTGSAAPV